MELKKRKESTFASKRALRSDAGITTASKKYGQKRYDTLVVVGVVVVVVKVLVCRKIRPDFLNALVGLFAI